MGSSPTTPHDHGARHRRDGPVPAEAPGMVANELAQDTTLHVKLAEAIEIGPARHRLHDWLTHADLRRDLVDDIALAAQELLVNAAEHAYLGLRPGSVHLLARFDDRRLVLTVTDTGSWLSPLPDPGHRGHGLTAVRALADTVDITALDAGTRVTAVFATGTPSAVSPPTTHIPAGPG